MSLAMDQGIGSAGRPALLFILRLSCRKTRGGGGGLLLGREEER